MVTFMGRRYVQPGAYSYTDPTALVGVGLGTGGIVALIGTATGGQPGQVTLFSDPVSAKNVYRGGNLINAANYAWAAGAQYIYLTRPGNPLQGSLLLNATGPAACITATSTDYGSWCNSIQIKVENSTSGPANCKITVQYYNTSTGQTTTEVADEMATGTAIIAYWAANYPSGLVAFTGGVAVASRPLNIVFTPLASGDDDLTPTAGEWSTAIDLYQKYDVNIMNLAGVEDAVEHAYLLSHCITMSNNRKERIMVCGGSATDAVGNVSTPGTSVYRAYTLNSSRAVLVSPGTDGVSGSFTAAKVVGMLAGVDVATSLTHQPIQATSIALKYTDVEKDTLITYGVCAIEEVAQGRRVIRSVTTAQDLSPTQENPFKEISIQRIADYVNYNMRTNLEGTYVGKKGITGIESSISSSASSILVRLKEAQIIQDFRNIIVKRDVADPKIVYISYEIAPISPINFIFITTKLVPLI